MNTEHAPNSKTVEVIHDSWRQNRAAELKELLVSLRESIPTLLSPGLESPVGSSEHRFGLACGTAIAVCAEDHTLAAEGYFTLANLSHPSGEPSVESKLWYEHSLDHANTAVDDFRIARAAYNLGIIEASQEAYDKAQQYFETAQTHADRADNPGGKSAALYRLCLLKISQNQLEAASNYAMESYVISIEVGHIQQAAETLDALFNYYHEWGFDFLARDLGLHLMTTIVGLVGSGQTDEAAQMAGAAALRAIAPLSREVQDEIFGELGQQFGVEIASALHNELKKLIDRLQQDE